MKPGRNDPCPCGSGKKYKHCCANLSQPGTSAQPSSLAPTANEQNHLIALYKAGRYAELENQARLFLQRYSDSSFGWKILSGALMAQGKDALHALQQTAKLLPQDAEVLNNLGDILAKREQLKEAEACFRKAIQLKPRYADALYNLGQILGKLFRHTEAEYCLRKAIELRPNDADAYNNLGLILTELSRPNEAEACFHQALALKPELPEAYCNLGMALRAQQRYEEAEKCYRRALELKPDFAEGNCGLGRDLLEQGRFAEAEVCFRRALESKPDYVTPRYWLIKSKKTKSDDNDFCTLVRAEERSRLEGGPLSLDESIYLHFALGKGFDDIGEYEKAFAHYLDGCRIKRSTIDYDALDDNRMFDEIERVFDTAQIKRLRESGNPDSTPIFVLGMPRSGTTLTEQIIASHPEVHGAGELPDMLTIAWRNLKGIGFPKNMRLLDPEQLAAWGTEYVTSLRRHAPNARHITDKMPHNFLVVGLIHLMLPNAKIIHVKRNPVDTCFSCLTNLFVNRNLPFSYNLTELGKFYVNYDRLMQHWRMALPNNAFLEVQYEDIVQAPETQAKRLISYCGLEWNAACLDFHKNDRAVGTASMSQVRQPIYRSSMEQWRRYEKHLGPLLDALGNLAPNR